MHRCLAWWWSFPCRFVSIRMAVDDDEEDDDHDRGSFSASCWLVDRAPIEPQSSRSVWRWSTETTKTSGRVLRLTGAQANCLLCSPSPIYEFKHHSNGRDSSATKCLFYLHRFLFDGIQEKSHYFRFLNLKRFTSVVELRANHFNFFLHNYSSKYLLHEIL